MEQRYRHFDLKERTLIYGWRKERGSISEIARRLQRSHASISRELRRNLLWGRHYYPGGAQLLYHDCVQQRAKCDFWGRVFGYLLSTVIRPDQVSLCPYLTRH